MWHCSGTINGLNIDTDMERENKKKERERETKIQSNDWWHRWVKREQSLDLDRLAVMIPIILFLSLFFFYFAKFKLGMLELAIQIFKTLSNTVKSSTEKVH